MAMRIQQADGFQAFLFNKFRQFLFFFPIRAARINDHAFTAIIIQYIGILGEGIEGEYLKFHTDYSL
jgi:hypothetical protein